MCGKPEFQGFPWGMSQGQSTPTLLNSRCMDLLPYFISSTLLQIWAMWRFGGGLGATEARVRFGRGRGSGYVRCPPQAASPIGRFLLRREARTGAPSVGRSSSPLPPLPVICFRRCIVGALRLLRTLAADFSTVCFQALCAL